MHMISNRTSSGIETTYSHALLGQDSIETLHLLGDPLVSTGSNLLHHSDVVRRVLACGQRILDKQDGGMERGHTSSLGLGVDELTSSLVGGVVALSKRVERRETTGLSDRVSKDKRSNAYEEVTCNR